MSLLLRTTGWSASTLIVLLLACADIGPPPGGEEDRSGPYVVLSDPPAGSVSIPSRDRITIKFSERITAGAQTRVHISPRSKRPPELKWRSDRLEIVLLDSLVPNQTYVVSITGAITDLRRNPADSALLLAFSTGPVIDSGTSVGTVYRDGKPLTGATIMLLPADSGLPKVRDSLQADYVTSSGKDGRYSFRYLPNRRFAVVAFEDLDRDGLIAFGREWAGVGDRVIVPSGSDSLQIQLVPQDTIPLGILSGTVNPDRLLRVRLTRDLDLNQVDALNMQLSVRPREDSALAFLPVAPLEAHERIAGVLHFEVDSIPPGPTRIALVIDTLPDTLTLDSVQLPTFREDRTPPVLQSFWPDTRRSRIGVPDFGLTFSEPLNRGLLTDSTFMFRKLPDSLIQFRMDWQSTFHLHFLPEKSLDPGAYSLTVKLAEVMDRSGNRSKDSIQVFSFSVLSEDSLGTLSGSLQVAGDSMADPILVTATDISRKYEYTVDVFGDDFRFDLPAGKYLLGAWLDRDRDRRRDDGQIEPFQLAEPRVFSSDTIAVRARFETAGPSLRLVVPAN